MNARGMRRLGWRREWPTRVDPTFVLRAQRRASDNFEPLHFAGEHSCACVFANGLRTSMPTTRFPKKNPKTTKNAPVQRVSRNLVVSSSQKKVARRDVAALRCYSTFFLAGQQVLLTWRLAAEIVKACWFGARINEKLSAEAISVIGVEAKSALSRWQSRTSLRFPVFFVKDIAFFHTYVAATLVVSTSTGGHDNLLDRSIPPQLAPRSSRAALSGGKDWREDGPR